MPAKSKAQQKAAGAPLSAKRGEQQERTPQVDGRRGAGQDGFDEAKINLSTPRRTSEEEVKQALWDLKVF
jgi:hypothetical protein